MPCNGQIATQKCHLLTSVKGFMQPKLVVFLVIPRLVVTLCNTNWVGVNALLRLVNVMLLTYATQTGLKVMSYQDFLKPYATHTWLESFSYQCLLLPGSLHYATQTGLKSMPYRLVTALCNRNCTRVFLRRTGGVAGC